MKATAQYEFAEVLQAGENFKVALCLDEYGKLVVSKSLIDTEDGFARAQLKSQIEFLRDSSHTGIVNFHDNTDTELFMEAMGDKVHCLMLKSGKQFSTGEVVSFLRQMLTLLAHLDSRNMAVGQLSPRTILANDELDIFKIAKAYRKDSPIPADANEKIFPPEVNSPEDYDVHASDLYCLGMSCIELTLGPARFESLFKGMYDNSSDLWIRWHENQYETLPPLSDILEGFPNGLTNILQKMIEKPLRQRYSLARDVLNDLNSLGIVDAEVTVKQTNNLSRRSLIVGCAAIALAGIIGWSWPEETATTESEQTTTVFSSKLLEIEIESNRDFDYQIMRNGDELEAQKYSSKPNPQLQEGDRLKITSTGATEGWSVSTGDTIHDLTQEVVLDELDIVSILKLDFFRTYNLHSKYKNFVWKYEHSAADVFEKATPPRISNDEEDHVWVKPEDPRLSCKGEKSNDGWFKVELNKESYTNQVHLDFVLHVEVELVGHSSLSKISDRLRVSVGGKQLSRIQGNTYSGSVPYSSLGESNWNLVVEHDNQEIAEEQWSNLEDAGSDKSKRRIELKRRVQFPDDVIVVEVNGKTGFHKNDRIVMVPLGSKLEFKITDRSGVIRIQDTIDWTDDVSVAWENHLVPSLLFNQGNTANFFLSRDDDPSKEKLIGQTNHAGKFPIENQDEYEVSVVMISNPRLRERIPLQEFLNRGSIELQQASVR